MNPKKKKQEETVPRDTYLRMAADFDNAKKEHAKSLEQMAKLATVPVVSEVLGLLDTLDEALAQAPEAVRAADGWFGGIERIRQQFLDVLGRVGAERIETKGAAFDPATMEAVGTVPASPADGSGGDSNTVQAEQRAGWRMHGRVIRPARVIVYS